MSVLYYRQLGSGPPLFILHGLYGSSDNWISNARQLAASFTVYLPDARNHGQSPHFTTHTFNDMADDLARLMDHLGIYSAFIAGHSMGGKTAINFASLYPERIKKLVILDISPRSYNNNDKHQPENHLKILTALHNLYQMGTQSRQQADGYLAQTVNNPLIRQFLLKNLHREVDGTYRWRLNIKVLLNSLPDIMTGFEGHERELQFYKNPVLFLKGALSDYIIELDTGLILKLFPHAQIKTIEGAGHWLHAEKPDEVNGQLTHFLLKES